MNTLERKIARVMAPALKSAGFTLKPDWNAFLRPTPYGFDSLAIVDMGTAAPGPRHHEISIHCSIRHDAAEIPWNTLGLVYGDAQLQTATLVLGFPRGPAAPKLKVFSESAESDVKHIATEGIAIFHDVAVPFYARFADMAEIETFVNARPLEDITPYTIGLAMEHRAFRSLILAKLVNPGRYAQVRAEFVRRDVGMFPRERRMTMLSQVDIMHFNGAP